MTLQTQLILRELLSKPDEARYGLDLCADVSLPSGTVYPILARLEGVGWLESDWEEADLSVSEGRPRRRYYLLTKDGAQLARHALAASYRGRRDGSWLPIPGTVGGAS